REIDNADIVRAAIQGEAAQPGCVENRLSPLPAFDLLIPAGETTNCWVVFEVHRPHSLPDDHAAAERSTSDGTVAKRLVPSRAKLPFSNRSAARHRSTVIATRDSREARARTGA